MEDIARNYNKGDELETVILAIDAERERISLGIKQLDGDPISDYMNEHPKGKVVNGKVVSVDARGAEIELAEGVIGYMRGSEMSLDQVDDARKIMKEGDEVEAMLVGVDRKKRSINLSIRAKDTKDEKQAIKEYSSASETGSTTIGDLLKEQMDNK